MDKLQGKIECCECQTKSIYIRYNYLGNRQAYNNQVELVTSGKQIYTPEAGRAIQFQKFSKAGEITLPPERILQIVAKVQKSDKYIVVDGCGSLRVLDKQQIIKLLKLGRKTVSVINAKLKNDSISAIRGNFFEVQYNSKPAENNKLIKPYESEKQQSKNGKHTEHNWGTILNYKYFNNNTTNRYKNKVVPKWMMYHGTDADQQFDKVYKGTKYENIMTGNNKFNMLNFAAFCASLEQRLYKQTKITDMDALLYCRDMQKPLMIVSNQLRQVVYRLIREDLSKSEKWVSHYKRTMNSIKTDSIQEHGRVDIRGSIQTIVAILADCVEYRIRNDKDIRESMKPINKQVIDILKNYNSNQINKISLLVMIQAYIDHITAIRNGELANQTLLVSQAIQAYAQVKIIYKRKYGTQQSELEVCDYIKNKLQPIMRFINNSEIDNMSKDQFLQDRDEQQLIIRKNYGIMDANKIYISGLVYNYEKVTKTYKPAYMQSTQLYMQATKLYTDILKDDIKLEYTDKNNITWDTVIAACGDYVTFSNSDDTFDYTVELYGPGQKLRKVDTDTYLICDEYEGETGHGGKVYRFESRLIFIKSRKGKTGQEIKDIIYTQFTPRITYDDFRNSSQEFREFGLKCEQRIIGEKVYYAVYDKDHIQVMAPLRDNFDNVMNDVQATLNKKYQEMNTDRPLLFSIFNAQQTIMQLNRHFSKAILNSGSQFLNSLTSNNYYCAEAKEDMRKIIQQLLLG